VAGYILEKQIRSFDLVARSIDTKISTLYKIYKKTKHKT